MRAFANIQNNIANESVAYGYTLSVWGSGALLLNNFSMTPESILAFVFGGVIGFGVLAGLSFRKLFRPVEKPEVEHIAASMIHLLASMGSVLATYLAITYTDTHSNLLVFLLGAHVTITYNILLALEELLSEDIYRFEGR